MMRTQKNLVHQKHEHEIERIKNAKKLVTKKRFHFMTSKFRFHHDHESETKTCLVKLIDIKIKINNMKNLVEFKLIHFLKVNFKVDSVLADVDSMKSI